MKVRPHIRASQSPYLRNGQTVTPRKKNINVNIQPHEAKIFIKKKVKISQMDKKEVE